MLDIFDYGILTSTFLTGTQHKNRCVWFVCTEGAGPLLWPSTMLHCHVFFLK